MPRPKTLFPPKIKENNKKNNRNDSLLFWKTMAVVLSRTKQTRFGTMKLILLHCTTLGIEISVNNYAKDSGPVVV